MIKSVTITICLACKSITQFFRVSNYGSMASMKIKKDSKIIWSCFFAMLEESEELTLINKLENVTIFTVGLKNISFVN